MEPEPALDARDVSKKYGEREVLCGVSLVAPAGCLHGLLGPNGAGKTTLMRIALGLVRPDGGTVKLLGSEIGPGAGGVPAGVAGFVETPAFYPYLSGRTNLDLLARLDNGRHRGRSARVDAALEQTGLSSQAESDVSGYSAGMRQRLGLAAALMRAPKVLLLDEPTSSLDPTGARDVRVLMRRLASEGVAVLVSSHDLAEVEELCGMITVLDHGRVVFSGTMDECRRLVPPEVHWVRTSDDARALELARCHPGVRVRQIAGGGLEASAELEAIDAYVIALGRAGVAVRMLQRRNRPLESVFLALTGQIDGRDGTTSTRDDTPPSPRALAW